MVFTVIWHYVSNHGSSIVHANTESAAIRKVIRSFSEDFGNRATLLAVKDLHTFRKASDMLEPEVLARRNDRAIVGDCTWFVDQDVVTDEDMAVWVKTESNGRARVDYTDIKEYLPA